MPVHKISLPDMQSAAETDVFQFSQQTVIRQGCFYLVNTYQ